MPTKANPFLSWLTNLITNPLRKVSTAFQFLNTNSIKERLAKLIVFF